MQERQERQELTNAFGSLQISLKMNNQVNNLFLRIFMSYFSIFLVKITFI